MLPKLNILAVELLMLAVAYSQSNFRSVLKGEEKSPPKPRSICDIVRCPFGLICETITTTCLEPPCPRYRCVKHPTCPIQEVPLGCRVISSKDDEFGCPIIDVDCIDQDTEVLRKCSQTADSGRWCGKTSRRWYYDRTSSKCHEFSYGGCDGNDNNFKSKSDCTDTCDEVFPCSPVVAYRKLPIGCRWETVMGPRYCPMPKIVC